MNQRVTVETCRLRRDGRYLIVWRAPGLPMGQALSDNPIPAGTDIIIKDGEVVG